MRSDDHVRWRLTCRSLDVDVSWREGKENSAILFNRRNYFLSVILYDSLL